MRILVLSVVLALVHPYHASQVDRGVPGGGPLVNLRVEIESLLAGKSYAAIRSREWIQEEDLTGDGDQGDLALLVYDFRRQRLNRLGLSVGQAAGDFPLVLEENILAFLVEESRQGMDLNGDGETLDFVVHVHDASIGKTMNLGLASNSFNFERFVLERGTLAFLVSEFTGGSGQGVDLNGDGDRFDEVLFVHDVATGITTNTGWANATGRIGAELLLSGGRLATAVSESAQGRSDLNGDGDRNDVVPFVYDLSTGVGTQLGFAGLVFDLHGDGLLVAVSEEGEGEDLNGDGDHSDNILHRIDLSEGTRINEGLSAGFPYPGHRDRRGVSYFFVHEGSQGMTDLNGDGDAADFVLFTHDLRRGVATNLGLSAVAGGSGASLPQIGDGLLAFWVEESAQGASDLNGDGDSFDCVLHVHDTLRGTTRNLGLACSNLAVAKVGGGRVGFLVGEQQQGETDLNGDGDASDWDAHLYDHKTGTLLDLGLANSGARIALEERFFVLSVDESDHFNRDRNGDHDTSDSVFLLYDLFQGTLHDLGVAGFTSSSALIQAAGSTDYLLLGVDENSQGNRDLNGNGNRFERVLHALPLMGRRPSSL